MTLPFAPNDYALTTNTDNNAGWWNASASISNKTLTLILAGDRYDTSGIVYYNIQGAF